MEFLNRGEPQHLAQQIEGIHHRHALESYYNAATKLEIDSILESLNLHDLEVEETIDHRTSTEFSQVQTMALWSIDEYNLAMLVGAGDRHENQPVATSQVILILSNPLEQTTFRDQSGRIYSSNFCIFEGGKVKRIRTNEPVPTDVTLKKYTSEYERSDEIPDDLGLSSSQLDEICSDKHFIKQLLHFFKFHTPKGFVFNSGDTSETLNQLLSELHVEEVFVKPNNASQGTLAQAFKASNVDAIQQHLTEIHQFGSPGIVEERIEAETKSKRFNIFRRVPDYNFRSLVVLDGEDAHYVDYEIRHQIRSDGPVNISQGAHAMRIQDETPDAIQNIANLSEGVARVLLWYANAKYPDQLHSSILGLDIIPSKNGSYIIEVNSGAVGGFSTITRILEGPMTSVKNRMMPGLERVLQRNFEKRLESPELEPIENAFPTHWLETRRAVGAYLLGEYDEAMRCMNELLDSTDNEIKLECLEFRLSIGSKQVLNSSDLSDIAFDFLDFSSWSKESIMKACGVLAQENNHKCVNDVLEKAIQKKAISRFAATLMRINMTKDAIMMQPFLLMGIR